MIQERIATPESTETLELGGGQSHPWTIELEPRQVATVQVRQMGIDVKLRLADPGGEILAEMDSPYGSWGPEELTWVSETAGPYRLEVVSESPEARPGRYSLQLSPAVPATDHDRRHAALIRLLCRADSLRRQAELEGVAEAKEIYRQTLEGWRQLGSTAWQLQAYQRLGKASQLLDAPEEAHRAYLSARDLAQESGNVGEQVRNENRLAALALEHGDLDRAKLHVDAAIRAAEEHDDEALLATATSNLATWYSLSRQTDRALSLLLEVEGIWRRLDRPHHLADTLNLRGHILLRLGKLGDASHAFSHAAEAYAIDRDLDRQITALVALGEVFLRQEEYGPALEALQEAETLGPEGRLDGLWSAILSNDLGLAHARVEGQADRERLGRALPHFERAKAQAAALGKSGLVALVEFNIGALYQRQGLPAEALPHFERALEIFNERERPLQQAMALLGIGLAQRDEERWSAALEAMQQAVDRVEDQRLQHVAWDFRMWFLASKQSYFEELVDLLLEMHRRGRRPAAGESYAERALRVIERRRARTFLDSLGESTLRNEVPEELLRREDRLRTELAQLRRATHEATVATGGHVEDQRRRLLLELEVVRTQIRQAHHQFAEITRPSPLGVSNIRRQVLDDDSHFLHFALGERRSFLFSLSRHRELEVFLLPARDELARSVRHALALVRTVSSRQDGQRRNALGTVADQLLGPVYGRLDGHRLIIVPDGLLELVPFAALRLPHPVTEAPPGVDDTRRRFLVESYETVFLPSASTLPAMRAEAVSRPHPTVEVGIVADPVFSPGDPRSSGDSGDDLATPPETLRRAAEEAGISSLARLVATRGEAEAIAELVPPDTSRLLWGFEARKSGDFDHLLRNARILHIATHGIVDRRRPGLSALALSQVDAAGEAIDDGWLSAHELYSYRIAAELVVLSACHTGVGPEVPGEGIQGLSRAFLYAGAPRVVTSLWSVDDASTADLMVSFYRSLLGQGQMPAAALREAQLQMLGGTDPRQRLPYFWAPFFFVGDWHPDPERRSRLADIPIERDDAGVAIPLPPGEDPDYPGRPDDRPPAFAADAYVNGIDAETGGRLAAAPGGEILFEARDTLRLPTRTGEQLEWWVQWHGIDDPERRPVYRVDPNRLEEAGWAVLFAPGVGAEERKALSPLLDLRREQAGKLYQELELEQGVTSGDFRIHHEIGFGPADPEVLPYYLLIVGDPREIPFELQYSLDVQYAVGRLHLETADDYARYAATVRDHEAGSGEHRDVAVFGVGGEDPNDRFLNDALVDPLAKHLEAWSHGKGGPAVRRIVGERKADLAATLDDRPAFLFAAGHGLRCRPDDPTLAHRQGALICSDHQGTGSITREAYFTGDDLPATLDLEGLVAFVFACYGAGTPSHDDFEQRALGGAERIAPHPMVSHLAKRMLSQGVQAFVGHIDRAWGLSFDWSSRRGDQVKVFDSVCRQLLDGERLGVAMEWINQRYAEGATAFNELLRRRILPPGGGDQLARLRKATLDARNYVVIGDPAVRLPRAT